MLVLGGKEVGPYSFTDLVEMFSERRILPHDVTREVTSVEWIPVARILGCESDSTECVCGNCGTKFRGEAHRCAHCGAKLSTPQQVEPPTAGLRGSPPRQPNATIASENTLGRAFLYTGAVIVVVVLLSIFVSERRQSTSDSAGSASIEPNISSGSSYQTGDHLDFIKRSSDLPSSAQLALDKIWKVDPARAEELNRIAHETGVQNLPDQ